MSENKLRTWQASSIRKMTGDMGDDARVKAVRPAEGKKRLYFRFLLFLLLALAGLGIRTYLIFGDLWSNDADLRNYYWAAQQAAQGKNPYELWSQDLSGPRSDLLPLELALLTAVVAVGSTPQAIRVFFLFVDMAVLIALLWRFAAHPRRQLLWFALYAISFGPLYFFVVIPSDKPVVLLTLIVILGLLESKDRLGPMAGSVLTGLLGAAKWFGMFFAVPAAKAGSRNRSALLLVNLAIIGGVFLLGHIPWLPDWLVVYRFRAMRFGEPFHDGLAVLLSYLGLPMAKLYYPLMIASWGLVTGAHLKGWIDTRAAIVLSIIAILIWASDATSQMLFLLTLMVLLIVRWDTPGRALVVWVGTSWMALMTMAAIGKPAGAVVDLLKPLSGAGGRISLALWSNAMLLITVYWLIRDQLARRSEPGPVR